VSIENFLAVTVPWSVIPTNVMLFCVICRVSQKKPRATCHWETET